MRKQSAEIVEQSRVFVAKGFGVEPLQNLEQRHEHAGGQRRAGGAHLLQHLKHGLQPEGRQLQCTTKGQQQSFVRKTLVSVGVCVCVCVCVCVHVRLSVCLWVWGGTVPWREEQA